MEKEMKINTRAVHAGDRKQAGPYIPSTTPVHFSSSFTYANVETLDHVFGNEIEGYAYARYDNPTTSALQELLTSLEGGHASFATASGMAALDLALRAALLERRKKVLSAGALYGATIKLLMNVFEPFGVETQFVDICNADAVQAAMDEFKPGVVLMETVSNPLLRVGPIDKIAEMARKAGAALIVDNTFASPLLVRPMELGAHIVVESLTKFLAGHGDVLLGSITSDEEHFGTIRSLIRTYGPNAGPMESYLAMRGIKTFPLRMERQCANAVKVAAWLRKHPRIERVHYTDDPSHPDAATIARLLPSGLYGAMVSVEIREATRPDIFAFMDELKLIVRGTSLGDVHTLILYPAMASHRDIAPKQRERMGIRDNLVRFSIGIEDVEDICSDLKQALE
jgi:cystathionine beta-lyase/cystathionine gamma-synthase